jgi:hypothetical protein
MTHSIAYRRVLNKLGYYNYQNGLIHNQLNQKDGWDSHLTHCRNFIIKAVDFYKPESITVLGSGWLLEIPLKEMLEKTNRVRLVDIVHPPDVAEQTGKLVNVELVEEDITGGLIDEVWQKTRKFSLFKKLHSLGDITIPEYQPDYDPGLLISVNLITQLESLLVDFIRKRSKISEREFLEFRTEIQKKHLEFLKKHKSVLITDLSETITDNSGNIREEKTLIAEPPSGKFREVWDWKFDNKRSDFYTKKSLFKIAGIVI